MTSEHGSGVMAARRGAGSGPAAGRPPVAVLFGGPSAEHDISIVSGNAIADALEDAGLTVSRILIDLAADWWWLPAGHRPGDSGPVAYDEPARLGASGPVRVGAALDRLAALDPAPVVFVALHGPFGEDGTVQALLEAAGLAYTGSGVAASAIGMDKALQKRLWRGLGLPVADWHEVRESRWRARPEEVLGELESFALGGGDPRLMVKPARLGSSVGISLAHAPGERGPALDLAFRHDTLAVVERYLPGARDLEVSVIGNDPAQLELYGPGEILSGHEFYDFGAKYTPGVSESSVRAEIPEPLRAVIFKLARDAYRSVGAEGFARVDFLLGGQTILVSEINTIPGFTPISLFPSMAAGGGYDFAGVCLRIVDLAVERHAEHRARQLTPDQLPR